MVIEAGSAIAAPQQSDPLRGDSVSAPTLRQNLSHPQAKRQPGRGACWDALARNRDRAEPQRPLRAGGAGAGRGAGAA